MGKKHGVLVAGSKQLDLSVLPITSVPKIIPCSEMIREQRKGRGA